MSLPIPPHIRIPGLYQQQVTLTRVSAIAPGESLASGADISAATNTLTNIDDQKDLLVLNFDNSLIGENSESPTSANAITYQAGVTNAGAVWSAGKKSLDCIQVLKI
jgi:hypothetical protein